MTIEKKENSKDNSKRRLALQKKYGQRITIARQGREAFLQKDYINASKKYSEYLGILADLKDLDDIYRLSPTHFDKKREITEMLLISHIYWEIARINETTPRLQKTYHKALSQFIKFTANQPYQVLNAEMLRKFIKKNKNSPQLPSLNEAYSQIFVQSKKCYIASMSLGFDHEHTQTLRLFKLKILKFSIGRKFVEYYYRFSPSFVSYCERHVGFYRIMDFFIKPTLITLAKFIQKHIL